MHKVDSVGATAQNEFTDGDAQNQVPRTRLTSKWTNAVQRELVSIILQAGITLSGTDDTQLTRSVVLHTRHIASLRLLPAPVNPSATVMMLVSGLSEYADGGGRVYYWNSASSTADNGTSVIRPSTNPATGRWLLVPLSAAAVASIPWSQVTGTPSTFPPSAHSHVVADVTGAAPINSPTFTGTPSAPTAAGGTNTTQLATTAFVRAAITALIDSSPGTLDTLAELATALGNDPNFATTIATALGAKAPINSPTFTGNPAAPTATGGTNTTQIATTAFVAAALAGKANSSHTHGASDIAGAFTGAAGTDWQQIPGGFIIQGGFVGPIGAGGTLGVSFPVSFPSHCIGVVAIATNTGGSAQAHDSASSVTAAGFSMNNAASVTAGFSYIAIGK